MSGLSESEPEPETIKSRTGREWGGVETRDTDGLVEFEGTYSGPDPEGFARTLHALMDGYEGEWRVALSPGPGAAFPPGEFVADEVFVRRTVASLRKQGHDARAEFRGVTGWTESPL